MKAARRTSRRAAFVCARHVFQNGDEVSEGTSQPERLMRRPDAFGRRRVLRAGSAPLTLMSSGGDPQTCGETMLRLLLLAAVLSACSAPEGTPRPAAASTDPPWHLTSEAATALAALAERADQCWAAGAATAECFCPADDQGGCYVGQGFIAYDRPLLPVDGSGSVDDPHPPFGRGIAYVPSGTPPDLSVGEFYLNGYTVVTPEQVGVGPHWYWTSICRTCD